jgi:hypothetical protein
MRILVTIIKIAKIIKQRIFKDKNSLMNSGYNKWKNSSL